jgi:hypothetical protein
MHKGIKEQLTVAKSVAYAFLQIIKQEIIVVLRHSLIRTFE